MLGLSGVTEKLAGWFLDKYLGKYLENLNPQDFTFGLSGGKYSYFSHYLSGDGCRPFSSMSTGSLVSLRKDLAIFYEEDS